jgi:hypothetical protein
MFILVVGREREREKEGWERDTDTPRKRHTRHQERDTQRDRMGGRWWRETTYNDLTSSL